MIEIRVAYYPPVGSDEEPIFLSRRLTRAELIGSMGGDRWLVRQEVERLYETVKANSLEMQKEMEGDHE